MSLEDFKIRVLPVKNKIYRFALRFVIDEDEAKDIVQEVFIKVWNKREEMQAYINIEAWCMQITKNLCLDKLKSKKLRSSKMKDLVREEAMYDTPYKKAERSDFMERIHHFINSLPEKQKQVIQLKDIEGYDYKEISEILGVDINQLKVNLFRARKAIKEKLINAEAYGIQKD